MSGIHKSPHHPPPLTHKSSPPAEYRSYAVIARSEATKQSRLPAPGPLDCFAALAMTSEIFSRRDLRPRCCSRLQERPLAQKRGKRSAGRRTSIGDRILSLSESPVRTARPGSGAARTLPLSPPSFAGEVRRGPARLSALHCGCSSPGRASWDYRVQTGGPSPAPVQRAPRSPVTRRTGRCPKPPGAECKSAPGTAPAPPPDMPPGRRPSMSRICRM